MVVIVLCRMFSSLTLSSFFFFLKHSMWNFSCSEFLFLFLFLFFFFSLIWLEFSPKTISRHVAYLWKSILGVFRRYSVFDDAINFLLQKISRIFISFRGHTCRYLRPYLKNIVCLRPFFKLAFSRKRGQISIFSASIFHHEWILFDIWATWKNSACKKRSIIC